MFVGHVKKIAEVHTDGEGGGVALIGPPVIRGVGAPSGWTTE